MRALGQGRPAITDIENLVVKEFHMMVRNTARVVVLNPAGAVLLVRYHDRQPVDPRKPELLTYWVPPGGGVDKGESFERAATRELGEETGIELLGVGPQIWSRERHLMHHGEVKRYLRALLCRVGRTPSPVTKPNKREDRRHSLVDPGRVAGIDGDISAGRFRRARRPRDSGRSSNCADRHKLTVLVLKGKWRCDGVA
jgi:8-oxo-dGTP pyrophosphatase MutT (NUDIX family)